MSIFKKIIHSISKRVREFWVIAEDFLFLNKIQNSIIVTSSLTLFTLSLSLNCYAGDQVEAFASHFITEDMSGFNRSRIIKALGKVPSEKFSDTFKTLALDLSGGMVGYDRSKVIKALGKVPSKKWDTFKALALDLSAGMKGNGRSEIIKALGKMPSEKYSNTFKTLALDLSAGMNGYDRSKVIEALGTVPSEQYNDTFKTLALDLSAGMKGYGRSKIIKALGKVPSEHYSDTFKTLALDLSVGMDGYGRSEIIKALGKVPSEKFSDTFKTLALDLSGGMGGYERSKLIKALGALPSGQWDTFKTLALDLSVGMNGYERWLIIKTLGKIYETFEPLTKDQSSENIRPIWQALRNYNTNATELNLLNTSILAEVGEMMDPELRYTQILALIAQRVEERRTGRHVDHENVMNAQSISKAAKSLEVLYKLHPDLTPEELASSLKEVEELMNAQKDSPGLKEERLGLSEISHAEFVLTGSVKSEPSRTRKMSDYDSINQNQKYTNLANGKSVRMAGVLARVWKTIKAQELKDKENLEFGLLKNLAQCFDEGFEGENPHVVCNTGKIQRLLLTLQGHIPGIEIDSLEALKSPEKFYEILMAAWSEKRDDPQIKSVLDFLLFIQEERPEEDDIEKVTNMAKADACAHYGEGSREAAEFLSFFSRKFERQE